MNSFTDFYQHQFIVMQNEVKWLPKIQEIFGAMRVMTFGLLARYPIATGPSTAPLAIDSVIAGEHNFVWVLEFALNRPNSGQMTPTKNGMFLVGFSVAVLVSASYQYSFYFLRDVTDL